MIQVFPSIEMLLVCLLQKAGHPLRRVAFPHKDILLVDDGIVRQKRYGAAQGCNQGIVLLIIAAEGRWKQHFPAHADVPALAKDNPIPTVHHREIVSDVYLFHTLLLTKMNLGNLIPAIRRERAFSPNFC